MHCPATTTKQARCNSRRHRTKGKEKKKTTKNNKKKTVEKLKQKRSEQQKKLTEKKYVCVCVYSDLSM